MPWNETSPMNQRTQFIADYLGAYYSHSELCELYGISRKTGYKWIARYEEAGPQGLLERSSRPHHSPNKTPEEIEQLILDLRRKHPTWGAKKLLPSLERRYPQTEFPCCSTVSDILTRNDMVPPKRRRRPIGHPGKPTRVAQAPDNIWTADFKGHFKTGDGHYCYPLTVTDRYSRFLLGCQGLYTTSPLKAKPVFTRLFKEYGLPEVIRTDNGVPFATTTLARLSSLSAWWVRLGIMPELIEPGKPQQNGQHERMHRILKAETTRPAAHSLGAQQRRFNRFRDEYNHERPHEALDQNIPASLYQPSPREMPNKLPPLEYPDHFEKRYVSTNGGMRWNSGWVAVSIVCEGEYVGLEEVDEGIWNVYFGPLRLGKLIERYMRIEDQYGKLKRRNV